MPICIPPRQLEKLRQLLPFKLLIAVQQRATPAPFKTPVAVQRSAELYIVQQGWEQTTRIPPHEWHGWYRTSNGSYKGKIITSTPPKYYIHKPPEGLKTRHSHRACFTQLPDDWYSVHFRIVPKDLDSGVIKLERILREAYLLTQKSA